MFRLKSGLILQFWFNIETNPGGVYGQLRPDHHEHWPKGYITIKGYPHVISHNNGQFFDSRVPKSYLAIFIFENLHTQSPQSYFLDQK